jgi:hypothetical protein
VSVDNGWGAEWDTFVSPFGDVLVTGDHQLRRSRLMQAAVDNFLEAVYKAGGEVKKIQFGIWREPYDYLAERMGL